MSLAKGAFSCLITIYIQVCGAAIFQLGGISWAESCKILGQQSPCMSHKGIGEAKRTGGKKGVSCISFAYSDASP